MDPIIITLVLAALMATLLVSLAIGVIIHFRRTEKELSFEPGVYTGPAGDPYWNGKLPQKVDDYTVPRYVYEDLTEDTEYLPEHGRIIGYRISPTLVTHSRVQNDINAHCFLSYKDRYAGKFFTEEDIEDLQKNWDAISKLRVKAGDTPLNFHVFWVLYNSVPVAYNILANTYKACAGDSGAFFPLFLKR